MKKGELIEAMVKESGETSAVVSRVFDSFLSVTTAKLKKGEDVGVTGFGTFKQTKRAARKGRNPSTGAEIKIAASKSVSFKVGATLKAAVNPAKKK